MSWVVVVIAYACLLALFLMLVGGVRRADRLHQRGAREGADVDLAVRSPAPPRPSRAAARPRRRSAAR